MKLSAGPPVIPAKFRMDQLPPYIVFRSCRVEVFLGDCRRIGILHCYNVSIISPVHLEVVFEYVFQQGQILPGYT